MVGNRLFDRACNDLQAQTKKVFELVQIHNALLARHAALVEAVKEYFAMREANIDKMNHEEYREWFAKHIAARAEVDKFLEEE